MESDPHSNRIGIQQRLASPALPDGDSDVCQPWRQTRNTTTTFSTACCAATPIQMWFAFEMLAYAVGGGEKLVHFGGLLDPLRGKHFRPASGVKAERSEPAGLGLDATG